MIVMPLRLKIPAAILSLICLLLFFHPGEGRCSSSGKARLVSVSHFITENAGTVELVLDRRSQFRVFELLTPDRFVIDIQDCWFPDIKQIIPVGTDCLDRVRVSQFQPDRVRIVLDRHRPFSVFVSEKVTERNAILTLSYSDPENQVSDQVIKPVVLFKSISEKSQRPTPSTPMKNMRTDLPPEAQDLGSLFNAPPVGGSSISDIIPATLGEDSKNTSVPEPNYFSLSGQFRSETAYRTRKPHHFSTINNIFSVRCQEQLTDNLSFVLEGRLSYDLVFDLTENYNNNVQKDQKIHIDLRDAYLDASLGNFDLRIGSQQIVWGQAVGLFFADIVNPKDLREYILPDLDEIRIPVFAVNLEYFTGSSYLQAVFIPFPDFNEFGKRGSEFDFSRPLYTQDVDIVFYDPTDPACSLDNSEAGLRFSHFSGGWDWSLFYLWDLYDFPVNYWSSTINSAESLHPITLTYHPRYERIHRFGGTFSKDVSNAILKGEVIYSSEMFFTATDFSDPDGILSGDTLDCLLGVDYTFWSRLETNFQLMQKIILDYDPNMMDRKIYSSFSVWMRISFWDNQLEPELFLVSSFNQKDILLRPKLTYNYSDSLKFIFGLDLFYGRMDGNFGIFDDNDRIYAELLYVF